jgi:hypothetical protein
MQPDDPMNLLRKMGIEPDPWQREVLTSRHPRILLNCCRQAGESTTVAALALAEAIFTAGTQVLLLSRSFRQASELYRKVLAMHQRVGEFLKVRRNADELLLKGGSRIVCLPCKEETIRGYSGIDLILIDEASRVPDDLYRAVRPMLAASNGRMICLSTPHGKRGFFWDAWMHGGEDWLRIQASADQISRISAKFLEAERRALGLACFRQEYFCSFEALEGLVFPHFARCLTRGPIPPGVRKVGGIDFGYRNPFAAVWGVLDAQGNLWITHEHYSREKPLSYHAAHLPREVLWYCDPSGASERQELRVADFKVIAGKNSLRSGIAAVNARIESARLFVYEPACPNLVGESGLYRYSAVPAERKAEIPIDEHNHALAALRYLIATIDERHMIPRPAKPDAPKRPKRPWLSVYNEFLWHPID